VNSAQKLPRGGTLLAGLVLYALILSLAVVRSRPPVAKPADAPEAQFSAARAKQILQQLVGNSVPHPVGSAADAAVRERIVAELNRLGYQPKIEAGFACDPWGTCAAVNNVVARLAGQEPGPAVMMASHYDSVPAGPGASDDGAGVAAELEIARALKASPVLRHPVILLMDEGEEAGLLGAEAFVASDPWAKDVRAVVNVEARGTSGPSAMFETGDANLWLMKMYARAVKHPNTSSINYTVYKLLPNDTDFTVFKRPGVGYQGFNFAFIGDVAHYHTPLDNFTNADVRSIQQQGQSALATLRALANSNLNPGLPSEAVFFDLFSWKTIWWPAAWTIWFAGIAFILLAIEISVLLWRGEVNAKMFLLGILSWPAILIAAGFFGGSFYFVLRKGGALPVSWVAHPAPMLTAFWALGFCIAGLLALGFWRGAGFVGLWSGTWVWWALVSLALAMIAPGVSYIFVLPALAAALCGLWAVFGASEGIWKWRVAIIFPGLVAGTVTFAMVWVVYDAMGGIVLPGITLFVALLLTPLVPVMGGATGRARWALPILALAIFVMAGITALTMPAYSASWPERLNLEYYQDADAGKSYWLATPNSGRLPQSLRSAEAFGDSEETLQPLMGKGFVADAPNLNFPAPTLTIQKAAASQGKVEYQVLLRSPRGAPEAVVGFPPGSGVESVSMNGQAIPQLKADMLAFMRGWHPFTCDTLPPEGIELQFTLPSDKPVSVLILDKSFGLPARGVALQKARPATAIASQDGDAVVVAQHVRLQPRMD
jgi:hypothetical protein